MEAERERVLKQLGRTDDNVVLYYQTVQRNTEIKFFAVDPQAPNYGKSVEMQKSIDTNTYLFVVYRPLNHWHFVGCGLDFLLKEYAFNGADEFPEEVWKFFCGDEDITTFTHITCAGGGSSGVPVQGDDYMCAAYALMLGQWFFSRPRMNVTQADVLRVHLALRVPPTEFDVPPGVAFTTDEVHTMEVIDPSEEYDVMCTCCNKISMMPVSTLLKETLMRMKNGTHLWVIDTGEQCGLQVHEGTFIACDKPVQKKKSSKKQPKKQFGASLYFGDEKNVVDIEKGDWYPYFTIHISLASAYIAMSEGDCKCRSKPVNVAPIPVDNFSLQRLANIE